MELKKNYNYKIRFSYMKLQTFINFLSKQLIMFNHFLDKSLYSYF